MLLNHGLDPYDLHVGDGYAPIHRACWGNTNRHRNTVKVFLEFGVPYDLKARNGDTPMKVTKNMKTVKLLQKWRLKSENNDLSKEEL